MTPLTRLEREAINDSVLKIQSIQVSLDQVDDSKIPEMEEIHGCLDSAHKTLRSALREDRSEKPSPRKRA
jgi:hypothetical protein